MTINIEQLRKHLQNNNPAPVYDQIKKLIIKKNYDEAYEIAEIVYEDGFIEVAFSLFSQLEKVLPHDVSLQVNLAEILIFLGKEEDALLRLEKIPEDAPEYVRALLLTADCYESFELYDVSERKLLFALEIVPDEVVIQFALAETYFSHKKYKEALNLYKKMTCQKFNGVLLDARIGECNFELGKYETALKYFSKIKNPTLDTLYCFSQCAMNICDYELAIKVLSQIVENYPDESAAYYVLAICYKEKNDINSAINNSKKCFKINETNFDNARLLATLYILQNKHTKAQKILKTILKTDLACLDAVINLGYVYLMQNRFSDIIEIIKNCLAEDDIYEDEASLNWLLASAYYNLEEYKEAGKAYEKAEMHLANNISFLQDYTQFLIEEGNIVKAKTLLQKLCQLEPTNEEFFDLLERI